MEKEKTSKKNEILPIFLMGCLFVIIYTLALASISPLQAGGIQPAFENPDDPTNIIFFLAIILIMTAIILLISKYWKKEIIQIIILGAIGYTTFYVISPLLTLIISEWGAIILSATISLGLVITLYKYPEWYVIDICGVIIGTGAIAIFGISLTPWLVILLLIILALYDAISVYKTKHMIDLADTVMDLKLPILLVIPKIKKYSLIKETKKLKEKIEKNEKRDAFFMGLGDIVIPGILVATAYPNLTLAVATTIGTLIGFVILMTLVIKGKPHAGLPCLNGGAIVGYIFANYLIFGTIVEITL